MLGNASGRSGPQHSLICCIGFRRVLFCPLEAWGVFEAIFMTVFSETPIRTYGLTTGQQDEVPDSHSPPGPPQPSLSCCLTFQGKNVICVTEGMAPGWDVVMRAIRQLSGASRTEHRSTPRGRGPHRPGSRFGPPVSQGSCPVPVHTLPIRESPAQSSGGSDHPSRPCPQARSWDPGGETGPDSPAPPLIRGWRRCLQRVG